MEVINFSYFRICDRDIELNYCDVEWLALKKN